MAETPTNLTSTSGAPAWRRLKVRLYLSGRTAHRRGLLLVDALWNGFWLGALSVEDFHAIDQAHYGANPLYQTDEHNRRGLMEWEEAALGKYFPPSGTLLATSVGGGREVLALAARGYAVEGYECHPALTRYAQAFLEREGCPFPVHLLARDEAPESSTAFDGAVVGWGSYMLMPGRQRRVRFLRGVRRLLREGDPVLLSFFTRQRDSPRARIVAKVGTIVRRLRGAEPVEIGDDLRPNYTHRFTSAEVASEMAEAGFKMAFFQPQGPKPHDSGWAVGLAAQRESPRSNSATS